MGFIVNQIGIEANPTKVQAILNMTSLRTTKELQSLVERVIALGRFISRSTEKCVPLFKVFAVGRDKGVQGSLRKDQRIPLSNTIAE